VDTGLGATVFLDELLVWFAVGQLLVRDTNNDEGKKCEEQSPTNLGGSFHVDG
jgi:hypothetical protein